MGRAQIRASIWLAILLASIPCAFALDTSLDISQYAHTAWTVRDGFTKGTIHSIAQTPDGYLWLGTEFGLLRFDGVRAVPWEAPAGEQLPGTVVTKLLVSRDGALWIAAGKGLASWKNGKLTQYPQLAGQIVHALVEDREGTVWAGGYVPAAPGRICGIKDGRAQCSKVDEGLMGLYEDSKGNLWGSAFKGLWRWKPNGPDFFPMEGKNTSAMADAEDGGLLVGTFSGIRRFIAGRTESYFLGMPGRQAGVFCFLRDHTGGLWVGTSAGLVHVHRGRTDVFQQVDGLSSNLVHALFEDREGSIWAATEGGLDRFREYAVPTFSDKEGLSAAMYGAIQAATDGSFWLGSPDGLTKWKNWQSTVYDQRSAATRSPAVTALHEISTSGLRVPVESIFQDRRGRLWIAVLGGFGYMENDKFVLMKDVPGEDNGSIAEGAQGDLWINFVDALFHLSDDRILEQIPGENLGRKDHLGGMLAVDPLRGGVWIGFWQGGVAYLSHGQIERSYSTADGLGEGRISHLRVDREGALWASTEGGLSLFRNGRVATLSTKNGLPCDATHWSQEDADHSVWLYLECGLVRIAAPEISAWAADSSRPVHVTLFDSSDGVTAKTVLFGSFNPPVTESSDGKLWFIVHGGVSVVDPRHLPFNKLPAPVHIERVIADGKTYWQNWSDDASFSHPRLPPLVRDLTIEYTALSMVVPEKVHFRFKLEGQDKDWREVVNDRRVEYSNLAPKNYRFRVIACNNSGVWNEAGDALNFSIAPTYYQTPWFRTLCVLTFLALLWTVFQIRVRALKRHQALLEQHQTEVRALNEQMVKAQEAERVRIAGELHDGVLQQITSLTLRLAKVKRQVPPNSEATATVTDLQQQLIKVGTDIRHISHELHPALLQEAGLPAALSAYCEEFSQVRGLPVSCETDGSVEELSPRAALYLYRIAQEALGNAAKHSEARKIEVRLTRADSRVCLSVSDNGVGCSADQIGKSGGLGLINMRERVLQLHGNFEFDSEPGRGTKVKVTVPFREDP